MSHRSYTQNGYSPQEISLLPKLCAHKVEIKSYRKSSLIKKKYKEQSKQGGKTAVRSGDSM